MRPNWIAILLWAAITIAVLCSCGSADPIYSVESALQPNGACCSVGEECSSGFCACASACKAGTCMDEPTVKPRCTADCMPADCK